MLLFAVTVLEIFVMFVKVTHFFKRSKLWEKRENFGVKKKTEEILFIFVFKFKKIKRKEQTQNTSNLAQNQLGICS
jgi:hypothetical protein